MENAQRVNRTGASERTPQTASQLSTQRRYFGYLIAAPTPLILLSFLFSAFFFDILN